MEMAINNGFGQVAAVGGFLPAETAELKHCALEFDQPLRGERGTGFKFI
jgi:hypothetical protein